ncbi:MAG: PilW family protein [Planctomycetota bacterium]
MRYFYSVIYNKSAKKKLILRKTIGFTLIELLVAVSLMVFLISIVAFIFRSATFIYSENEDLINIANNGRSILESLNRDLMGTLSPSSSSRQCFRLVNDGENNFTQAKDGFIFNSITTVLQQTRPVRVKYTIVESIKPKTKEQRITKVTRTRLWKFKKEVREVDGSPIYTADNKELVGETLSEYLGMFNIQYEGYEQGGDPSFPARFFELDEQPGFDENGNSYADMISTQRSDLDNDTGPCIGDSNVGGGSGEEPKLPRRLVFYYQIFANEKEQVQKIYRQEISIQAR